MRNYLKPIIALFVIFQSINVVWADDPSIFQSAQIEHAVLTPAGIGGVSTLRIFIRNMSSDYLTILGVRSPHNNRSQIMVSLGGGAYTELDALPLEREENLDLSSSHMIIHLLEITQPIEIDEKIELNLILANGELPFTAHVRKQEVKNATRS